MESVVTTAQQAGFTLIELMIVTVIVAIFVTVGVPNFQNLISDNRLSAQANRLVSSLQLARSEALQLRTPVSICRSTDGANCAGAGAWETGWLVFVDTNANGDVDGQQILLVNSGLSGSNTLRAAAAPFTDFINYQPNGLQSTTNVATYRICDGNNPDVNQGRQITISSTGRVQTKKGGLVACP